ncbi:MAG: hypothetical protein ABJK20_12570 [Halieaceae bacterium]
MINRFKNKLRLSGLEDVLQRELQIPRSTSAWLSRLAYDLAQQNGHNLLGASSDVITSQVFWQLERAGYSDLLDDLAANYYMANVELQRYRSGRGQQAA